MAKTQVNPTRMELTRLKKKLVTALRGHKLLKDKRDELMRQFLDLVKENKQLREKVEKGITRANQNFVLARADMQEEILQSALLAPKQEVYLESGVRNVMSVDVYKRQAKWKGFARYYIAITILDFTLFIHHGKINDLIGFFHLHSIHLPKPFILLPFSFFIKIPFKIIVPCLKLYTDFISI